MTPIRDAIEKHVHAAERLHIDDTAVPVFAKNNTDRGHASGT
jgi:hypothetical protein